MATWRELGERSTVWALAVLAVLAVLAGGNAGGMDGPPPTGNQATGNQATGNQATGNRATGGLPIRIDATDAFDANPQDEIAQDEIARQAWAVLREKCVECHRAEKRQGRLDMTRREKLLRGGDSGPALVPGKPDKSLMIELIEFDEMPPRKQKEGRVTKAELRVLKRWVASGAADAPPQDD